MTAAVCPVPDPAKATRGTSNGNASGSSHQRRARKHWLIETFRADVDVLVDIVLLSINGEPAGGHRHPKKGHLYPVPLGEGEPACRCYRCGCLLVFATLTVDRVIPGCKGGTYRRNNIRPACGPCNSETGGGLRS